MGKNVGYIPTITNVFKQEGAVGFYRGWMPPFVGSVVYRSVQFAVFEACYTKWKDSEMLLREIPGTFGLQYRVVLAGFVASSARAIIECPFEYAKVKRQTG
jgi:solute carrier family 25 carnitine/acylcarnitine transporter 20/29